MHVSISSLIEQRDFSVKNIMKKMEPNIDEKVSSESIISFLKGEDLEWAPSQEELLEIIQYYSPEKVAPKVFDVER